MAVRVTASDANAVCPANRIVKHPVSDYAAWRTVYEAVQPLRDKHGVSAADVLHDPADVAGNGPHENPDHSGDDHRQ